MVVLALIAGCDWAAADGPWNDPDPDPSPVADARVSGRVCTPSGLHDAPGLAIELVDAADTIVGSTSTDPWGGWTVQLPPGRYTLEVGAGGNFRAFGVAILDGDSSVEAGDLCLERGTPQALLFRSVETEGTDLLDQRLAGLGLDHVHDGPSDSAGAAQILASPAGLVDYGIVALLGGLDFAQLAAQPNALDGLRDHLGSGGGLFLASEAWPILDALAPGSATRVGTAFGGFTVADVVDPVLEDQLQWPQVGLPVPKDGTLLVAGPDATPLLRSTVPVGDEAQATEVDLLFRLALGGGTIVVSSFLAPPPRADGWWMGDPGEVQTSDGVWEGRGAVLDRTLLQL